MSRVVVVVVAALLVGPSSSAASEPVGAAPTIATAAARDRLVQKRHLEEDAHLGRLAIWGLSSVIVGGALMAVNIPGVLPEGVDARPVLGFGIQSAAWGAIDLGIVGLSFLGDRFPPSTRERALAEENTLGDVLWLNVGLDAGYMMAGGTMIGAGLAGADPAVDWMSHGAGIVVQGGALLVLDAVAIASHGDRLTGLWNLPPDDASASPPSSSSLPSSSVVPGSPSSPATPSAPPPGSTAHTPDLDLGGGDDTP